jgi:hypothetical protein
MLSHSIALAGFSPSHISFPVRVAMNPFGMISFRATSLTTLISFPLYHKQWF